mgnify:CR=1 FL=1
MSALHDLASAVSVAIAALRAKGDETAVDEHGRDVGREEAARGLAGAWLAYAGQDRTASEKAENERLRADVARLSALKSAEVAEVLQRFRAAFGVNVPRAPATRHDSQFCPAQTINRERWARMFPTVPWIDDAQDRTNYLLNEYDRASGKRET